MSLKYYISMWRFSTFPWTTRQPPMWWWVQALLSSHRPARSHHLKRWLLFADFGQCCGFCKHVSGIWLLVRSGSGQNGQVLTHMGRNALTLGPAGSNIKHSKVPTDFVPCFPIISLLSFLSWFFCYKDLISQNLPYSLFISK